MSSDVELEDPRVPILELAALYARAGMRVFPVDMRRGDDGAYLKRPPHGYLWKERASSNVNEVVEDVLGAVEALGEAHVGIGWALGLDGCLALDLDHETPPWWSELVSTYTALNRTARGIHLIYRQPAGRRIGNGTAGFPSRGWGEVRGHGGYIIVAGPDRPGFDVDELLRTQPFPRPEWLTDAGVDAVALELDELRAWLEDHSRAPSVRGKISGYRTRLTAWREGESRHDTAVTVACWIARESAAGLVNAGEALELLAGWWRRVGERPGRRLADRELTSIVRWAVGVALADPARIAELAAREGGAYEVDVSELVTVRLGERSTYDPVALGDHLDGKVLHVTANLLTLDDGRALLHRRRLNEVHGDSGSGKSWIVVVAIAELLVEGASVALVDFESDPSTLIVRLRQIGVSDDAIRDRLLYFQPDEAITRRNVERLLEHLHAHAVAHLFVDSLGEAFALEGIDENSDAEVAPWYTRAIRPVLDAGYGVTIVDHITKAGDNALHPSGSKRKRAEVDGTSWLVVALEPFTIADGGRIALRCGKDRHGAYRRGQTIAYLDMSPLDVTTGRSSVELVGGGEEGTTSEDWRDPLDVLVEALETYGEHNMKALEALMKRVAGWSRAEVRSISALAVKRGLVLERRGPNNARQFAASPADSGEPANGTES